MDTHPSLVADVKESLREFGTVRFFRYKSGNKETEQSIENAPQSSAMSMAGNPQTLVMIGSSHLAARLPGYFWRALFLTGATPA